MGVKMMMIMMMILNMLKMNIIFIFSFNSILLFIGFEYDSFCVLVLIEFNITFIETVILVLSELEEDEEVSLFVI